jgi:hypothetical protein
MQRLGLPPRRQPLRLGAASCLAIGQWLAIGAWSGDAGAQVNVEALRRSLSETGFGGKLEASLATYQGNTQGTNLGASGLIGARAGRHLVYAHASGRYAHLGGEVSVANYFAHLRYNYQLAEPLWTEALAQAQSDRFRRLELRQLLGAGLRWAAFDTPELSVYYGLTYLFEYNRLGAEEVLVRPDVVHRLGNYLSAVLELEDARAVASTTLYYQPRFDALDDYRVLWVSSLDFRITGRLGAGINATVRHENPVLRDLKSLDLTVINTLGLTL